MYKIATTTPISKGVKLETVIWKFGKLGKWFNCITQNRVHHKIEKKLQSNWENIDYSLGWSSCKKEAENALLYRRIRYAIYKLNYKQNNRSSLQLLTFCVWPHPEGPTLTCIAFPCLSMLSIVVQHRFSLTWPSNRTAIANYLRISVKLDAKGTLPAS